MKNNKKSVIKKGLGKFGDKVIKLKYFLMVVGAMLFEILTLVIFIFRDEILVGFDVIAISYFYGLSNTIILILAIRGLVKGLILTKSDKEKEIDKVSQINNFKEQYIVLSNRYSSEIDDLLRDFDSEKSSIRNKIDYAKVLEDRYEKISEEFSKIKVADFLTEVHGYEQTHLRKEKLLFTSFIELADKYELNNITRQSNKAHVRFLRELEKIEQNLKFRIEDISVGNLSYPPTRRYSYFNL